VNLPSSAAASFSTLRQANPDSLIVRLGLATRPRLAPGARRNCLRLRCVDARSRSRIILSTKPALVQFALGELEVARGRLEPALAAAEQAARLAPAQPVVYRLLAVIHLRQQNYPALRADLDAYLRLDPDSPAGLRAKELRAQAEKQLANSPAATVSAHK